MEMERKPVESSMLASVGYDPASRTLELEFNSGRVYRYYDVEPEVYVELMEADSKGRYFLSEIRGAYRYAPMPKTYRRRRAS